MSGPNDHSSAPFNSSGILVNSQNRGSQRKYYQIAGRRFSFGVRTRAALPAQPRKVVYWLRPLERLSPQFAGCAHRFLAFRGLCWRALFEEKFDGDDTTQGQNLPTMANNGQVDVRHAMVLPITHDTSSTGRFSPIAAPRAIGQIPYYFQACPKKSRRAVQPFGDWRQLTLSSLLVLPTENGEVYAAS
jgi:hypothetical protein